MRTLCGLTPTGRVTFPESAYPDQLCTNCLQHLAAVIEPAPVGAANMRFVSWRRGVQGFVRLHVYQDQPSQEQPA